MTEAANAVVHDAAKILDKTPVQQDHGEVTKVSQPLHALPHSQEDVVGHKALHGTEERKEHKVPDAPRS